MSHLNYPNESAEYREARNKLLTEEVALRRQIEGVAAQRRALPAGGEVPQDYLVEWIGKDLMPEIVEMSKLFGRRHALILYSFMYGPERVAPCPMCTHLLDSINGHAGSHSRDLIARPARTRYSNSRIERQIVHPVERKRKRILRNESRQGRRGCSSPTVRAVQGGCGITMVTSLL